MAVVIGLAIVGLVGTAVLTGAGSNSRAITGEKSLGGTLSGTEPNINKLARSLFSDYVFAFEVTSILLVIAVLAPWSWPAGRSGRAGRAGRAAPAATGADGQGDGAASRRRTRKSRRDAGDLATPTPTWYLLLAAVAVRHRARSGCSCGATRS